MGLIGRGRGRVGCLLHPESPGNAGRDWRALSYYGAKACRTYFCPTTERLGAEHQLIIREGIDHWYLYGMVITEHRLWSAFFRELEHRIGRPTTLDDFIDRPGARMQLQRFAALKLAWPFRRAGASGLCHFFFEDESNPRPAVERADATLSVSPYYETIFRELESYFTDDADVRRSETMLEGCIENLVAILRG